MEVDFSQEIISPVQSINRLNEIINRHASVFDQEETKHPSINDELEILVALMGLGRLIEFNIRSAWQMYAFGQGLKDTTPAKYNQVIKLIEKHFTCEPFHYLIRIAQIITDGLVHGNFHQAFSMSKRAYERDDLNLRQDGFKYQTVVLATLTKSGLIVDAITGKATTSFGEPVPFRAYIPHKEESFERNFESFYISGAFVPVYDILLKAFERAFHFRKCVSNAIEYQR